MKKGIQKKNSSYILYNYEGGIFRFPIELNCDNMIISFMNYLLLLKSKPSNSHFTWFMVHGFTATRKKKIERNFLGLHYWLKLRCCVRRRIAILIRYTLNKPLVQYWRSHKDWISVNFHLLILSFTKSIPFWLYKNMWSSACLEAQENVLLLILLPVFDIGSFIALLYLPYSLQVGYLSARV